jgi:hypothetical protein
MNVHITCLFFFKDKQIEKKILPNYRQTKEVIAASYKEQFQTHAYMYINRLKISKTNVERYHNLSIFGV